MKIQNLAVIFVIIILPISIVLSTYTGKLINVSKAQADYDKLLMNSTYDAIRAYQMNTLNDEYDQLANSKVRDINASISSFFNSLAAGMSTSGYTKRELMDYVPAILYTLYDGYYVYSAYDNIARVNDGTLTINERENLSNKQYGLKPFCYYSCTYEGPNYNLVVNYTLDNYITVTGTYNGNSIAASGYYIKYDNIKFGKSKSSRPSSVPYLSDKKVTINVGQPNEITIEPEKLGEYLITVDTRKGTNNTTYELTNNTPKYYQYVIYNSVRYYLDANNMGDINENWAKQNISDSWTGIPIFYLNKGRRVYINADMLNDLKAFIGNDDLYNENNFKDVNNYYYYYNAAKFSESVAPALKMINLGINGDEIKANQVAEDKNGIDNLVNSTVIKTRHYHQRYATQQGVESHIKTTYDTPNVFDTTKVGNDPELESSSFNQHRMDVIISSIENSLMNAISNYSNYTGSTYDYNMPIIQEDEWDRICNNLTVVSFMQGVTLKNYKYYSGYAVVANTKVKDYVSKDSIYVQNDTASSGYLNSTTEYHNPRCLEINNNNTGNVIGYRTIDYLRQDVYKPGNSASGYGEDDTDGETYYYYLQPGQAAYECNVGQNNNIYTTDELITGKLSTETTDLNDRRTEKITAPPNINVRRAYISALAREKGAKYNRYSYLNL